MSLISMVKSKVDEVAPLPRDRELAAEVGSGGNQPAKNAANAVEQLTRYIPTEIVTLYIAWWAVLEKVNAADQVRWWSFFVFLILTPIVAWMIFAAKVVGRKEPIPWDWKLWPKWKFGAATAAYVVWVFSLPKSVFATFKWYDPVYAGFAILLTTIMLGILGGIFDPIPDD